MTSSTTISLGPRSLLVFRAKSNTSRKPSSQKEEERRKTPITRYHIAYKINPFASCTKAICGLICHIDWATPFEIISLDDELTKGVYFTESYKLQRKDVTRNITAYMCMKCLSQLRSMI